MSQTVPRAIFAFLFQEEGNGCADCAEFVLESERILRTFKQWNSHLWEIVAEVLGVMFGTERDRGKGNGNKVLCL